MNDKGLCLVRSVQHDQYRLPGGCPECDIGEDITFVGAYPHGTGTDKFGGMRDDVIGRIVRDLIAVDGHGTQATVTTSSVGMGLTLRVGRQVPFYDIPAPVTCSADDQLLDMFLKIFF